MIVFIFTDEASECGDAASSTVGTGRQFRDWAAQVESEQQQEAGYSTDSMIHSATLPRGAGGRGGRRGWQRGRPPLPNRQGVHITMSAFLNFSFAPCMYNKMIGSHASKRTHSLFIITDACLL